MRLNLEVFSSHVFVRFLCVKKGFPQNHVLLSHPQFSSYNISLKADVFTNIRN